MHLGCKRGPRPGDPTHGAPLSPWAGGLTMGVITALRAGLTARLARAQRRGSRVSRAAKGGEHRVPMRIGMWTALLALVVASMARAVTTTITATLPGNCNPTTLSDLQAATANDPDWTAIMGYATKPHFDT